MIDSEVFYARLNNHCKACPSWKNVCLKGHALSAPEGCPLRKFPPVEGAAYAEDKQAAEESPQPVKGCCGEGAEMPPLTWGQVLLHFTKSVAVWIAQGLPLVDSETHGQRYGKCKTCDKFNKFYCKQCKCVAYLKTKLATEVCPLDPPRWN